MFHSNVPLAGTKPSLPGLIPGMKTQNKPGSTCGTSRLMQPNFVLLYPALPYLNVRYLATSILTYKLRTSDLTYNLTLILTVPYPPLPRLTSLTLP